MLHSVFNDLCMYLNEHWLVYDSQTNTDKLPSSSAISSAGNSVWMNMFCVLDLGSSMAFTSVHIRTFYTLTRNLIPLLLILHPQLDLCAACLEQNYFQFSRPCGILICYPWAYTTELYEVLLTFFAGYYDGEWLVEWVCVWVACVVMCFLILQTLKLLCLG